MLIRFLYRSTVRNLVQDVFWSLPMALLLAAMFLV